MELEIKCRMTRCLGYGRMDQCYTGADCRAKREIHHSYSEKDLEKWRSMTSNEKYRVIGNKGFK